MFKVTKTWLTSCGEQLPCQIPNTTCRCSGMSYVLYICMYNKGTEEEEALVFRRSLAVLVVT